jgi:hypothetical protein
MNERHPLAIRFGVDEDLAPSAEWYRRSWRAGVPILQDPVAKVALLDALPVATLIEHSAQLLSADPAHR